MVLVLNGPRTGSEIPFSIISNRMGTPLVGFDPALITPVPLSTWLI
jgi:hypothetical protein